MYCKKCGQKIGDNEKFCKNCGEPVQGEMTKSEEGNSDSEREKTDSMVRSGNAKRLNKGILVAIAVVAVIAVIGGIMFVKGKKEDGGQKQNEEKAEITDIKSLIGVSVKEAEQYGFQVLDDSEDPVILQNDSWDISLIYEEDKMIAMTIDENCKLPFYGIKMGDTIETAEEKLETDFEIIDSDPSVGSLAVGDEEKDTYIYLGSTTLENAVEEIKVDLKADVEEYRENLDNINYIFPDSDEKYLSEDEIRSVSVEDMALGRNEIYARHGYIFNEEPFKSYFESQSWYEGTVPSDQFNADQVFNDFEKKNVELIKQIEDEVNGSGASASFMGLNGWYTCTTASDGTTGHINIAVGADGIAYITFRTLETSYDIWNTQGTVVDNQTIQINYYDCIITFTWTDTDNMYVTREGEFSGMDAGVMMDITDYQSYVRSAEFN